MLSRIVVGGRVFDNEVKMVPQTRVIENVQQIADTNRRGLSGSSEVFLNRQTSPRVKMIISRGGTAICAGRMLEVLPVLVFEGRTNERYIALSCNKVIQQTVDSNREPAHQACPRKEPKGVVVDWRLISQKMLR